MCLPCRREYRQQRRMAGLEPTGWPKLTPEQHRRANLKRYFGITPEQYDEMLQRQGGVCAICGNPEQHRYRGEPRRLSVDHCHGKGKVRGLLCSDCNMGLGQFKDDPVRLRAAIKYLQRTSREARGLG